MRLFPLFNSILRTALDADGKKIVNLGTPTQDTDAATKKYVDENGGGGAAGKLPMKPLPKYLHYLAFNDTYPADAAWLYAQLGPSDLGRCSAVRRGGKLWRNYDWTFDDAAEFVVKVSCSSSRFGSVGVASVGSRLTENDVMSAVNSRYYKCLPGMTLDGINDKGVVCEINVDGGPKTGWHGDAEDEGIHILAAVRWVLDHGETAAQAAVWIADHIIQPTGDMNFHFMVADATSTYIVENGSAHDVTDGVKVLTNYALFDEAHAGGGKERYLLLRDGSTISAVNFTNAYAAGNNWHSDFESEAQHASAIEQWAAQGTDKEAHRGKTTSSGKAWWQSVHTTEYDFAAKTMKVAVQEVDDWYVFAVDQANVDLGPIEAQIAALQDGKRDKDDYDAGIDIPRVVGPWIDGVSGEEYEKTSDSEWDFGGGARRIKFDNGKWYGINTLAGVTTWTEIPDVTPTGAGPDEATHLRAYEAPPYMSATRTISGGGRLAAKLARAKDSSGVAKLTADGVLVAATPGTDYLKEHQDISGKRDREDNTCHKTEFTEWITDVPLIDALGHSFYIGKSGDRWCPKRVDDPSGAEQGQPIGDPDSTELEWGEGTPNGWSGVFHFTATRSTVCTDGKKFVTSDVVDGRVSAAISTNNPAFVSAVRDTPAPEPGQGEDPPWGEYGTLGAAIAGLVAGLKLLKDKIFGTDGKPTNTFATDLLGKQVAIEPDKFVGTTDRTNWNGKQAALSSAQLANIAAVPDKANTSDLPIPIVAKSGSFTTESYKRFVVASMPSAGFTLTLHTPTGSNADVFECRFNGAALSADASVSLIGATATTMDTDCGTVTAGKVALMSAFWNGTTWDVNWKVEG